jgi:hypothetical protein
MATPAIDININQIFAQHENIKGEDRSNCSYNQLRLTKEDKKNIELMITVLASDSIWTIAYYKSKLEELGHKIWGVSAIKQLECGLTDSDLTKKMQTIFNYATYSYIWMLFPVRNGYFDGLSRSLEANEAKDTLRFIPDFAKAIHKENLISDMEKAVQTKNWEEFFRLAIMA